MDGASYHKSKITKKEIANLGFFVLMNAPGTPELNPCEDFIRDIRAKLYNYR